MSNYSSFMPTFIKADNEIKLQAKLMQLTAESGQMLKIINIYKSGDKITAWFYRDMQRMGLPSQLSNEVEKPTIKKKASKKVSKKKKKTT